MTMVKPKISTDSLEAYNKEEESLNKMIKDGMFSCVVRRKQRL